MLKVLIAEDDLAMADLLGETLVDHGYEVCGIARTVAEAIVIGCLHRPELAVIDLRLANGGIGIEVAKRLGKLGRMGVLYATGNGSQFALTAADGDACLAKPFGDAALLRGLEIVRDILATGRATPPFPRGFQVLPPPSAEAPRETSNGPRPP